MNVVDAHIKGVQMSYASYWLANSKRLDLAMDVI